MSEKTAKIIALIELDTLHAIVQAEFEIGRPLTPVERALFRLAFHHGMNAGRTIDERTRDTPKAIL